MEDLQTDLITHEKSEEGSQLHLLLKPPQTHLKQLLKNKPVGVT